MRAIVLALALMLTNAALAEEPTVNVEVGGNDGLDACMSQGEVTGLKADGDNFLAVRNGPGAIHDKLDELHGGDIVNVCEELDGWFGIVYGGEDCGTGTPIEPRQAYSGPCKSGWVSQKFVIIVAG